jgi:hypothetical protein
MFKLRALTVRLIWVKIFHEKHQFFLINISNLFVLGGGIMFNDYEFYMLSKLQQKEIMKFANEHMSYSSIKDQKNTFMAKVKSKPKNSTACC